MFLRPPGWAAGESAFPPRSRDGQNRSDHLRVWVAISAVLGRHIRGEASRAPAVFECHFHRDWRSRPFPDLGMDGLRHGAASPILPSAEGRNIIGQGEAQTLIERSVECEHVFIVSA